MKVRNEVRALSSHVLFYVVGLVDVLCFFLDAAPRVVSVPVCVVINSTFIVGERELDVQI